MSRMLVRLGVVLTAVAALVATGGSVAGAHVSVHADESAPGSTTELAFRVPNESDTASTISVRLSLPAETPLAEVTVLPVPGWRHKVTKAKLPAPVPAGHGHELSEMVSEIEWSAARDAGVGPGEYQVFRVAGSLPEADRLIFKVIQTYDDGQVQRWIDEPAADGSEPENPAPVLALDGNSTAHGHGAEVTTLGTGVPAPASAPSPAWWAAVTIAMVALVAALGSVLIAIRTARRREGGAPPA
jgi:periplasmic copper chaperone A